MVFKKTLHTLVLLGLPVLASTAAHAAIVLGQSAPFTGPLAGVVKERTLGAKAYFDKLNAQGGIHGEPVEVKSLEDAGNPDKSARNTEALIADPSVVALFNYSGTPNVEKSAPAIAQAKIALMAPFTGAVSLRDSSYRTLYHVRGGYDREIQAAIAQMVTVGVTSIAVFHTNDGLGKEAVREIQSALKARNLQPKAVVSYTPGQPIGAAVEQMLRAGPELVLCGAISPATAALIKGMRDKGFTGQFMTFSNASSQSFVKALGDQRRGVAVTQVVPHPSNIAVPVVREFRDAVKDAELSRSFAALEGFISAKVMGEALRRAGPHPSRERVLRALDSMKDYDAGGFYVSYSGDDRRGSRFVEITIIDRAGQFLR